RLDAAAAVGLHPAVVGDRQAVELLREVLDHVTSLWLAVYQDVEADPLLRGDDLGDALLDEPVIATVVEAPGPVLGAGAADLGGLREGADRGRRQLRQRKPCPLQPGPLRVGQGSPVRLG